MSSTRAWCRRAAASAALRGGHQRETTAPRPVPQEADALADDDFFLESVQRCLQLRWPEQMGGGALMGADDETDEDGYVPPPFASRK